MLRVKTLIRQVEAFKPEHEQLVCTNGDGHIMQASFEAALEEDGHKAIVLEAMTTELAGVSVAVVQEGDIIASFQVIRRKWRKMGIGQTMLGIKKALLASQGIYLTSLVSATNPVAIAVTGKILNNRSLVHEGRKYLYYDSV